jgi:hypothetical protein
MEVGESGYDDGDGDVFGRSYVCARMEVRTLTRQKDIYSTLTRQKDIYSVPKKTLTRQKDIYSTLTRQKDIYSCPKKDFDPPKGHLLVSQKKQQAQENFFLAGGRVARIFFH